MTRKKRIVLARATLVLLVPPLVLAWIKLTTLQFGLVAVSLIVVGSVAEMISKKRSRRTQQTDGNVTEVDKSTTINR